MEDEMHCGNASLLVQLRPWLVPDAVHAYWGHLVACKIGTHQETGLWAGRLYNAYNAGLDQNVKASY